MPLGLPRTRALGPLLLTVIRPLFVAGFLLAPIDKVQERIARSTVSIRFIYIILYILLLTVLRAYCSIHASFVVFHAIILSMFCTRICFKSTVCVVV